MPSAFIVRRKVYRGAYNRLPRRAPVPVVNTLVPPQYSRPAQPRVRPPAIIKRKKRPPIVPIKRARGLHFWPMKPGASAFGAVEQAATIGAGRRLRAVRVVRAVKDRLARFPLRSILNKRGAGQTPYLFPGTVDSLPSLRLTSRRTTAARIVFRVKALRSGWQDAVRARHRRTPGAYDYSPTDFTPVFDWRPRDYRRWKSRLVGTLCRIKRASWGDGVRARRRRPPTAVIYSPTEQATAFASPFLVENTRRRRTARMIARRTDDRRRWPRKVTAKLMPVSVPDASVHATGAPGLMSPGRKFWRNRWSLYRPRRIGKQRRIFRQPLQPATPFVFDGTLVGTLRQRPTYQIDQLFTAPAYSAATSSNGEA